jgi:hypothetical protein
LSVGDDGMRKTEVIWSGPGVANPVRQHVPGGMAYLAR